MKKETALLVGAGVGLYLLYSKSASAAPQAYPAGFVGPTQPGSIVGGVPVSAGGSIISWLSNIFKGSSNTGGAVDITDINQIGAQPEPMGMTDISQNCVPNGNPCDPSDCSYVPGFCDSQGTYS